MKEARGKDHIIGSHLYESPEQGNLQKQRVMSWLPGGGRAGERRNPLVIASALGGSLGGDENILELTVVMVAQIREYPKNHRIGPFTRVNCGSVNCIQ